MQLTQIQRVSGNFLKIIQTSSNRVTVISKIIRVELFRVGNVLVAHGTAHEKKLNPSTPPPRTSCTPGPPPPHLLGEATPPPPNMHEVGSIL